MEGALLPQFFEEGCLLLVKEEATPSLPSTMRKNLPQNQTQKGVEKPTSPRLTLRFQSIRSRDEKSSSRAHDLAPSVSSAAPKYQSYCVTMEARGDVYDFNGKKDDLPSSTTSSVLHDDPAAPVEIIPSSSPPCVVEPSDTSDLHELSSMAANGSTPDPQSNEAVAEDAMRKRRRSSNDSSNGGSMAAGKQRSRNDKGHVRGQDADASANVSKKRCGTSSSDTESAPSEVENDTDQPMTQAEPSNATSGSQAVSGSSPKVPPLKIVLPPSSGGGLEAGDMPGAAGGKERKVSSSKQALPYVVSTADSADGSPESTGEPAEKERRREESTSERCQRVTRSSHRAALSHDEDGGNEEGPGSEVHPRKRKLRTRDEHNSNASQGSVATPPQLQHQGEEAAQPAMNGYQLFLNIRRQVQKRRHSMFIVHPKPPQGFKDYLLNRGSYVLEGNPSSRLSVPIIPPPQSLTGTMKDLFVEQESERYKLRLQHLIEREKLVLSAEQEILRVHGRAARAIQNQAVPLSACSILRDEEIYNVLEPEQEDRDKNVRSRYNGRLFLSWLQDVDDKWEKIKESMLLRHHNEAESLHAVQKLDWEWKLKELGLCDVRTAPVIDDICVPMVHVSDDFDLLPA